MTLIDAESSTELRRTRSPLRAGTRVEREAFHEIRTRLVLDSCKWAPQVGDVATLADFPLLLTQSAWDKLACAAEELASETLDAERELASSPAQHKVLGVPRPLRRVFKDNALGAFAPAAARVMRFDFHLTRSGWRISEVNSDVPGGFCESTDYAALMAAHVPGTRPAGLPGERYADALAHSAGTGAVALLCAAGYLEDQEVVSYLGRQLHDRGVRAVLCGPHQLRFQDGHAHIDPALHCGPIGAIVRFYQGEWLARLPRRDHWRFLVRGGCTPVANPGTAILTESKRFPLVWDRLETPLPAWRRLLPETRDPRHVPSRELPEWVLKSAYCNTGDSVFMPSRPGWRAAARAARWNPGNWIAQERLDLVSIPSPMGPIFPCLGVYVIDGSAAGIYGRVSGAEVIDFAAVDIPVLIERDDAEETLAVLR